MNNFELIPNRIFVGGLPVTVNETELKEYFIQLTSIECVKDVKIINTFNGNSKGFGFVTFESENEVSKILNYKPDSLIFKDTQLNIAHAYKRNRLMFHNRYRGNNANMTIQTDNMRSDRFCMSPNSGKVLNVLTPTSPLVDVISNNQENNQTNEEVKTTESDIKENENTYINDNLKNDECIEIQKEDDNNNIISTKVQNLNLIENDLKIDNSSSEHDTTESSVYQNSTITTGDEEIQSNNQNLNIKNNNYIKNNQRVYNNRKGNYNNRYQSNFNQNLNTQPHGKLNNQNQMFNQKSQQYGLNSPIQYYYTMNSIPGNVNSPVNQQTVHHMSNTNQITKPQANSSQNKNKKDFKTNAQKSSNDYVGSIMNGVSANHVQHIDASYMSQPNYHVSYGVYQNQQNKQIANSQNSVNVSVDNINNNCVQSSSTQSYSSSSSSSTTSNTQNVINQVNTQTIPPNYQMNTNNTAVTLVNHVASINSAAIVGGHQNMNTQKYAVYPNHYYYPNNQNQQVNTAQSITNEDYVNTTTTSSSNNNMSNQQNTVYYTSNQSITNPDSNKNFTQQKPSTTVSTISNAFETATNEQANTNQVENLNEMIQNKLNIKHETQPMQQQQQAQYYYVTQPGLNEQGQPQGQPQYYVCYAPTSGMPGHYVQNYQYPVQKQIVTNGNFYQTPPPNTYPVQMNGNQMPIQNYPNQQQPITQYSMSGYQYQYQASPVQGATQSFGTTGPLLQLPPIHYQNQQAPLYIHPSQQNQIRDNRIKLQSPIQQGQISNKVFQSQNKNQYYHNQMYQTRGKLA